MFETEALIRYRNAINLAKYRVVPFYGPTLWNTTSDTNRTDMPATSLPTPVFFYRIYVDYDLEFTRTNVEYDAGMTMSTTADVVAAPGMYNPVPNKTEENEDQDMGDKGRSGCAAVNTKICRG